MNLNIRTGLLVAFIAVGLLPLAGLTWLTYERTLAREFNEVKDRHLLLAENLSSALSRYERDLRTTVKTISSTLGRTGKVENSQELLNTLGIQSVSIVDPKTGDILHSSANSKFSNELLAMIKGYATTSNFEFTPVFKLSQGINALFLVAKSGENIAVAQISTKYFQELGKEISFGEKGHAAIVDQHGNVLSHPLDHWVKAAKNISAVSAVKRMMNGETGVERFYSPALEGDMIAGLTVVPGPGWGVMIPQPISELEAKAFANLMPLLAGFLIAILLTIISIRVSMRWLARPLENFNSDLQEQLQSGVPKAVAPCRAHSNIVELQEIVGAYNELARTVDNHASELAKRVYEDTVTGIGNRAYFTNGSKEQIRFRTSQEKRGVLIFLDLDGFKEINDVRGHSVGDAVLKAFAQSLYPAAKRFMDQKFRGITGTHPIIGRFGGDEFAILLPIPCDTENVAEICEELRDAVSKPVRIDGIDIPCNVSAGGAIYPDHGESVDELVRRADVALYRAKSKGKGGFVLYNRRNALGGKSEILAAVTNAIENDELILEYQPKFCLKNQDVTGVEALLRWQHPVHGRLTPDLFLNAIQKTNVMRKLGDWVAARAISEAIELENAGYPLKVAINIGTEHFSETDFVPSLIEKCEARDFPADRIQIEITEDVMDTSRTHFKETVENLQQNGFTVAIDDFGRGFSNLTRLANIPVDVIKLDRSLIDEASSNERVQALLNSSVEMAHALGSAVIVEGVETLDQVKMAELAGADALQGFYYSASLTSGNLLDWMEARAANVPHQQFAKLNKSFG
ncbi:MAG: EAL domain-containing protein [Pseudomonadota bacterium]